jgi:hypothetical protein
MPRTGRKTGRKTGRPCRSRSGRFTRCRAHGSRASARVVRGMRPGYYAIDPTGKIVSGPHARRDPADRDARRMGGWVELEPG